VTSVKNEGRVTTPEETFSLATMGGTRLRRQKRQSQHCNGRQASPEPELLYNRTRGGEHVYLAGAANVAVIRV